MTGSLVALTPSGMMDAQNDCIGWAEEKLKEARHEVTLAEQNFNALNTAKMRTATAQTMIRKAWKRVTFYEKVKAALDAGYYIIPPFDVQVFAIRIKKQLPSAETGQRNWVNDQSAQVLPIGDGRYVDPRPERLLVDERTNDKGTTVKTFKNTDWREMELPARAVKPQIIEATGKALSAKIFDALGIAPAFRSADPIIVGHLIHPDRNRAPLTFFIAWWLDYSDL